MTLQEYQNYLHSLYQGDSNTPDDGEDDYEYRTNLLIAAIHSWDNEPGVYWNELWKMNSAAQTQTGDGSDTTFTTYADFRFPGGFVREILSGQSTYHKVVPAERIELYRNEAEKLCWFTGNKKDGFVLNFLTAPSNGSTIEYPYYKDPFEPSSAAHVIEMADPWYAVYFALSKLHEQDGEGDRATLALQVANGRLSNMRIRNLAPVWNQDNAVRDQDYDIGVGGFGR